MVGMTEFEAAEALSVGTEHARRNRTPFEPPLTPPDTADDAAAAADRPDGAQLAVRALRHGGGMLAVEPPADEGAVAADEEDCCWRPGSKSL